MSVPTNLIPTLITGLQEYTGSSTLGYMPYIIDGRTYKVQFANIAAVGAVPSSRVIAAGTGLAGGGDLSANRVISIANGGVGFDQLALSGVTQGTYGSGSAVPILTVDSKGRITSATTAPLDVTGFVPTSRTITAGDGLTGGGSLANNISLAANFSATTPSALGTASAGTANTVSRGDHVHPAVNLSDTTQTQGALPLGRGGTGDALSPVAGAVVYSTGTKFALTNPGLPGQVLSSNGTDEPQWTSVGAGTVISVGVATANGFAGTVTNPSLNPVITLSTTVTGMLKGDGTAVSAATAGVDYVEPGAYVTSGLTMASARLLGRTTASVGAAEELTVGTGLTLSGGSLVNAAPDQVVALTGGTAISVTGTYPSFTITNTAPDQTVSLTAGTAISISGTYPSFSVTNTAPDQVVSLTGAGTTTVTGTYPSFTITSNDSTSGTVTSVNASGGTTGMSFTGGPITSAGTLTLNGTLAVANGGTGATDAVAALTNLGAYPASNPAGYTSNVGTVTSVSGTGTVSGLSLSGTVTSAGSLTLGGTLAVLPSNFASQTANTVLAAPNGSAGVPTFRNLVAADVPTLNQNTTGTASNVTGIVAVANGGTGASVAGTARTNLGAAASGANTDITSIALTTGTISTSPTSGTDIVNKDYADSIASGINFHQSVRLATTAALSAYTYNNGTSGVGATITANANGALSVDGVAAVAGNRVLIKNESGAAEAYNGVYTVTQVGNGSTPYILTRATDFDSSGSGVDQIDAGDFFLVTAGSTLANTSWVQQTPLPITVGTTAIVFTQFGAPITYSAGTGLSLTGTTFSITNTGVSASTYGSASSVPVIAVNAQGQITSASSSSIAIAASQITSGALAIANGGTGATSAATALTNLGAYPASNPSGFTSNTGTVTSVNLTAGTGVSVSGGPITASGSITVTNTAPDQVVSLTGSGATTVTGTYPNFTISSPTSGAGTVTSIDVSGGTTGLTTSGGPVTSSGTITLAGTLNVANGGTGATTLSSGYVLKGNGTSAVSASVVYDDGTNAMVGGTSAFGKFTVEGNTNANLDIWIRNNNAGSSSRAGLVLNASGNSWRMGMGSTANNSNALTWNLDVGGANTEYMRLTTGGNFAVGGTTTTARLTSQVNSGNYILDLINGSEAPFALRTYNHGSGSAPGLVFTQGLYYNTTENASIKFYRGGGATGGYLGFTVSDGTERLSINNSGNVTANVDFRAPIFYDSNNTAFYADMAGTTSLNAVSAGTITATNFQATNAFYVNGTTYYLNSTGGGWYSNARIQSEVDMRAPIFYDFNNTGYYVDPASTSNLVGLTVANTITGNAATATNLSTVRTNWSTNGTITAVVGQLAWKNYGNNHTIFDASASTSPGGSAVNNTNAEVAWAGSYPTLMGWNGNNTYGVRVDSARVADSAGAVDFNSLTNKTGGTGTYTTSGDFRAPIFYDSDNTAYYINGAGNSVLNTLYMRNGSIEAKFAQASQFGYSSSYRTVVLGNEYLTTISMGVDVSGNASGSFNGQGEGREVLFRNGVTFITPNSANNSYLTPLTLADGYAASTGSFRAPIFYDSDNTGYYGDFAGVTNLADLRAPNVVHYPGWPGSPGIDANAYGFNAISSFTYANNAPYVGPFVAFAAGGYNLQLNAPYSGNGYGLAFRTRNGDTSTFNSWQYPAVYGVNVNGGGALYATIYYDQNNTAYYIDPASGTVLNRLVSITGAGNANGGNLQLGDRDVNTAKWSVLTGAHYGGTSEPKGVMLIGSYSASGNNSLSIGGNVYEANPATYIAFYTATTGTHPTGGSNRLNINGSGNVTAEVDMRAPIFYDSDNTGYYLNPNGTSLLLNLGLNGGLTAAGAITVGSGDIASYIYMSDSDEGQRILHCNSNRIGFLTQAGGWGSWCEDDGSWRTDTYFQAPIYYDINNTGYYFDGASTSVLFNLTISGGGNKYLQIQSTDNGEAMVRYLGATGPSWYVGKRTSTSLVDTASFHFYSESAGATVAGIDVSGNMLASGSMRAPIFYDTTNTAYYWNFADAGGSFISTIITGFAYFQSNRDTSSNSAPLQAYSTGGLGATMAFHRAGVFAVNMGLDSDNIFRIGGWSASNSLIQLDMSGNFTALTSSRAPIFYDSNDTAYYLDPASYSVLSNIQLGVNYTSGGGGGRIIIGPGSPYSVRQEFGSDNTGWRYGIAKNVGGTVTIMFYVQDNGDCVATGNVTAYSDVRLKANIETIPSALDKLDQIRGVTYTRTDMDDKERRYAGVIAQEIEAVLPEAVGGDEDIKTVDYNATIALLIQAVKELTNKVKALEAKEQ